ncbi:hypothetical protein [Streptomyces sp. NPDC051657]|uniref:hypothetical protein n=1 Tax=unclassified Streptomyces TaxID=2593676 RepID=UPI003436B2B0
MAHPPPPPNPDVPAAATKRTPRDPALTVAACTTAAGTSIDDSTWTAKGLAPEEDEVELTIGAPNRT